MKMKHFEASVIEDNGGGLTLYVFGRGGIDGGKVIYSHAGYEYVSGQLSKDVQAIIDGTDPAEWEGMEDDPQASYDALDRYEYGWECVAQVYDRRLHVYPGRMGAAASTEFIDAIGRHNAAAALGSRTSERKAETARINGSKPVRPGSRPRGRPTTK